MIGCATLQPIEIETVTGIGIDHPQHNLWLHRASGMIGRLTETEDMHPDRGTLTSRLLSA